MLSNLGNRVTIHGKFEFALNGAQDGIELAVNEYIRIAADR